MKRACKAAGGSAPWTQSLLLLLLLLLLWRLPVHVLVQPAVRAHVQLAYITRCVLRPCLCPPTVQATRSWLCCRTTPGARKARWRRACRMARQASGPVCSERVAVQQGFRTRGWGGARTQCVWVPVRGCCTQHKGPC